MTTILSPDLTRYFQDENRQKRLTFIKSIPEQQWSFEADHPTGTPHCPVCGTAITVRGVCTDDHAYCNCDVEKDEIHVTCSCGFSCRTNHSNRVVVLDGLYHRIYRGFRGLEDG